MENKHPEKGSKEGYTANRDKQLQKINVTMAVPLVGKGRPAFALSKLARFTLPKDDSLNTGGKQT